MLRVAPVGGASGTGCWTRGRLEVKMGTTVSGARELPQQQSGSEQSRGNQGGDVFEHEISPSTSRSSQGKRGTYF